MLPPQDVSIYLNNALKSTHTLAELDRDASLPLSVAEMPDQVSGRFVSLDPPAAQEVASAWKRVMIFNETQVLYTFTYEPATAAFTARKR
ncbi:MAG: hypothetical protein ABSG79_26990 [Bryobacteraceae bacterium]|jgi:hypothetical protein